MSFFVALVFILGIVFKHCTSVVVGDRGGTVVKVLKVAGSITDGVIGIVH